MWLGVPAVGSRASSSSSSAALEPPEDTYIPPHPRPLLRRPVWASLDGLWDHVVLPANASSVAGAQVVLTSDGAPIRVPFPIESNLSQVRRSLGSDERLWYRRKFHFADGCGAADSKIIRFGAVDWEAHVWFNGQPAGTHRGGYEPFELDVGPLVYGTAWGDGWRGPHELLVAVLDPSSDGSQPLGKQSLDPSGIWYTASSGIWQSVMLECAPPQHVLNLRWEWSPPSARASGHEVGLRIELAKPERAACVALRVDGPRSVDERLSQAPVKMSDGERLRLDFRRLGGAVLWSVDEPRMYSAEVRVAEPDRDGHCGGVWPGVGAAASLLTARESESEACAALAEGEGGGVQCPAGQRIRAVRFASWGTPSGSCADGKSSVDGGLHSLRVGACHTPLTMPTLLERCVGRAACALNATNSYFGDDPCPGMPKALAVVATCAPPPPAGTDAVLTHFGLRDVRVGARDTATPTLELNGAPTFVWALLDQGFWPHGLHTAPDDDALLRDIVGAKRLGFNALRKHIKVEPQRWYWWADWVGLLVLQDMPCARMSNERHTVVLTEATADDAAAKTRREHGAHNFRRELEAMVAALEAHPSIIMWTIFNEGWSHHDARALTDLVRVRDPTRLVNTDCGFRRPGAFEDHGLGDVVSIHSYPQPQAPPVVFSNGRLPFLGEFGGLGLALAGSRGAAWGYKTASSHGLLRNATDLARAYAAMLFALGDLARAGKVRGAVYTQLTDVEDEVNGLVSYDRAALKLRAEWLRERHAELLATAASSRGEERVAAVVDAQGGAGLRGAP